MRIPCKHGRRASRPLPCALTLLAVALQACNGGGGTSSDAMTEPLGDEGISPTLLSAFDPAVDEAERDQAAEASLRFGLALYRAMAAEADSNDNLVISPTSVSAALGMLLPGAAAEAEDELTQAMHLQQAKPPHQGIAGLLHELARRDATDGVTLSIANRSFVQRDWAIHPEYVEALARWFGDAMATSDFATEPDAAREQINHWVAARTNELIPELMPEGSVDTLTRLVLVNALYLLADWHEAFDPEATRSEAFTRRDGETVSVDMMHSQRDDLPVAQGPGFSAFELAYAGEELALTVIVPEDWDSFAATLDAEQLMGILDALAPQRAEIGLPKLETRTAASLIPALRALGVERIFEAGQWLSGIAEDPDLHVAAVQHETVLKIDEEGTEAAAATGVGVGVTSVPPETLRIIADRPHLLVLRDRSSGGILFLGRIVDPTAE